MAADNQLAWNSSGTAGGWRRWAPRDDIAPDFQARPGELTAGGRVVKYAFGGWTRRVEDVRAGAAYTVNVRASFTDMADPASAVWALVYWHGDIEGSAAPEVLPIVSRGVNELVFSDRITAPHGADSAEVQLLLRWSDGSVTWREPVFAQTNEPPASRNVKVSTVYWRPPAQKASVEYNVEHVIEVLDGALADKPDIVLMPDSITAIGVFSSNLDELADTVPGPIHERIAAKARDAGVYVIYTIDERDGEHIFATSVLVDRKGEIVGKHRKTQPPVHEAVDGFAPGESLEVFETDFGKIGILICGETLFPETARVLALKGAEMLFVPIWGGFNELLIARAIENGMWVVTSGYDMPSMFINPLGQVVAQRWKDQGDGAVTKTIDLEEKFSHFYPGRFPEYYQRLRRPDIYDRITSRP